MKKVISIFLVAVGLLATCLRPLVAHAQGHQGHHQSGIIGQVQRVILFHSWNVRVVADTGEFVTDFLTAADGTFQVYLKPGTYVLTAYYPDFGPQGTVWGTPVEVTVGKKQIQRTFLPITLPPQ